MATDLEHNMIIAYNFGQNKHVQKVLSDKEIAEMTIIEGRFPLTKLPVCNKCEKLGLWSKDILTGKPIGVCKSCGTVTKSPVTYSTYLARGFDLDKSGKGFREMLNIEKKLDEKNRICYLPDFNRLDGGI